MVLAASGKQNSRSLVRTRNQSTIVNRIESLARVTPTLTKRYHASTMLHLHQLLHLHQFGTYDASVRLLAFLLAFIERLGNGTFLTVSLR